MNSLRHNKDGMVVMLAILAGVMVLGYIVISKVLLSDEAKEVKNKAGQVINTLDKD